MRLLGGTAGYSLKNVLAAEAADPRHAPADTRLWRQVAERGALYAKRYQGQLRWLRIVLGPSGAD